MRQETYREIEVSNPDELVKHQAFLLALSKIESKCKTHIQDGYKKADELRKLQEG